MKKLTKLYSLKIKQAQGGIEYAIFKKNKRYSSITFVYNFETRETIYKALPDFLTIPTRDKATKLIFNSINP